MGTLPYPKPRAPDLADRPLRGAERRVRRRRAGTRALRLTKGPVKDPMKEESIHDDRRYRRRLRRTARARVRAAQAVASPPERNATHPRSRRSGRGQGARSPGQAAAQTLQQQLPSRWPQRCRRPSYAGPYAFLTGRKAADPIVDGACLRSGSRDTRSHELEGPSAPSPWQNSVSLPGRAEPLRIPVRSVGRGCRRDDRRLRMVGRSESAVGERGGREEERVSG